MNGFLLDTNVVSELRKGPRGNPGLRTWYAARDRRELFLSVITLAELRRGIVLIAKRDSDQAKHLENWYRRVQRDFGRAGRLLSVRTAEAKVWGDFYGTRPLPILDCFLAATAKVRDLTLVTRNERDFADLPIAIINPFTSEA